PGNTSTLLRDLPPLVWRLPARKKPVLSAPHSMMFGHVSSMRIPRLRLKFFLRLPSLQESWNSILILKMEVRAEEKPEEPMEVDDQVQTQGQEEEKAQGNLTSFDCSPRTLKGNVRSRRLTEKNGTGKDQVPAVSFHSKGHGVPSAHSPAEDILLFGKPDPASAALPGPVPDSSHWPEKAASPVLGKDHLPSSSGLQIGGEGDPAKDPAAFAASSSSPPGAASRRSHKRKLSGPSPQLPLAPPLQLRWERDELPPPAKLPCLSLEGFMDNMDKNMGALSRTSKSRRLKKQLGRIKK
uniref:Uncharacterized protein n=1 Tax=Saimiri boliviensis boliviensis TaxID=39432 RepID=A0A2K6UZM4_SAIBB